MYELYIVHSGILGMRWGVRRFQNRDGSLTAAGKARYSKGGDNPRHKDSNARKAAKQRAANLEKARKAKAEKAKFEADKKNALERGSATDIMKFKGKLTTKEMNDALSRLDAERRLSEISAKEIERGKITLKKITAKIDEARSTGESLTNAWNFVAKIHNSFADEDDAWQQIGQPSVRAKKEKAEKSAKTDSVKKDKIAAALKTGMIDDKDFATLSKIRGNVSEKDLSEIIAKMSVGHKLSEVQAVKDKAERDKIDSEKRKIIAKAVSSGKISTAESNQLQSIRGNTDADDLQEIIDSLSKKKKEG